MRATTYRTAALLTATAVSAGMLAPVAGADDHGNKLGQATSALMRHIDVSPFLGEYGTHKITAVDHTKTNPLLCVAKRPHWGRKVERFYQSRFTLFGAWNPHSVAQRVYVYKRIRYARNSFARTIDQARKCTGTWRNGNWADPADHRYRVVLSNGRTTVRSQGKRGVWIAGNFENAASATVWAYDWYDVYLRAGHTVMVFRYETGASAWGVGLLQRRTLNKLAGRLAYRWLLLLGKNWH